jgi:hypothetical protein
MVEKMPAVWKIVVCVRQETLLTVDILTTEVRSRYELDR